MRASPQTDTDCSRVLLEMSRIWCDTREREQPVAPPSTHASANIFCHISCGKISREDDEGLMK
jgi:hypothetical protein